MSNNIEIEAKVLLSKSDYDKVAHSLAFTASETFTQTNHYIDSKARDLKANGIALRVREKDDEIVLTLKTPLAEGLLEKNQSLTMEESRDLIVKGIFPAGNIADFLEILDIDVASLEVLATLVTKRMEKVYKSGKVALDENSYCGRVDYELEMEESSIYNAQELIKEILDPLGIVYEYNTLSKQSRAINAKDRD